MYKYELKEKKYSKNLQQLLSSLIILYGITVTVKFVKIVFDVKQCFVSKNKKKCSLKDIALFL